MPRRARALLPDGIFHVTARAVADAPLFEDDPDRRLFLWLLNRYCVAFSVRRRAYCLMGTHYHLLLEGRAEDLSTLMHRLNSRYAQRFNDRHSRHGHLFAERYSVRIVAREEYLDRVYEYIHANPANAGLCEHGERWPWSWSDVPVAA